jgi:hypothetical protein
MEFLFKYLDLIILLYVEVSGMYVYILALMRDTGSRHDEVNEFFSIYLIIPTPLGHGVHSAFNRNEYQKHKNNVSGD